MKCYNCNGDLKEQEKELEIKNGDYTIILRGVKAYVCDNCGEIVYNAKDLKLMRQLCKSFSDYKDNERPDFLNVSDVATLLNVSNQTIYNMIRDKRLKPVKIGKEWRFMKKDIDSIINNNDNSLQMAARDLKEEISDEELRLLQECIDEEE